MDKTKEAFQWLGARKYEPEQERNPALPKLQLQGLFRFSPFSLRASEGGFFEVPAVPLLL